MNLIKSPLFENKKIGFKKLRTNVSDILNDVINNNNVIFSENAKKNNADTAVIISKTVLENILSVYTFNPISKYDDKTSQYEVIIDELNIYACGDTKEDAVEMLLDLVIDSTNEYFENTDLYFKLPEQKAKYPYFLLIKQCRDREHLKNVLNLI